MSAQPLDDYDPVEILRVLPNQFHDYFLAEYRAAVEGARQVERYRHIQRERQVRPGDVYGCHRSRWQLDPRDGR
ncbi:MAG: hypothetical protein JWN52_1968 [Actinomycetia bacterium]|nr:hypothetical protein [Actinomycetes bacterium]